MSCRPNLGCSRAGVGTLLLDDVNRNGWNADDANALRRDGTRVWVRHEGGAVPLGQIISMLEWWLS